MSIRAIPGSKKFVATAAAPLVALAVRPFAPGRTLVRDRRVALVDVLRLGLRFGRAFAFARRFVRPGTPAPH